MYKLTAQLLLSTTTFVFAAPAFSATPDWITKSNADAQILLKAQAQFYPESVSQQGMTGYDDKIVDLKPRLEEREINAAQTAINQLQVLLDKENDPLLQQDLRIMIRSGKLFQEGIALNQRYLVSYEDVGQDIFSGQFALLQDQVDPARRAMALTRLKRYTGMEAGYTPLIKLAQRRYEEQRANPKLLAPYNKQVEEAIGNTKQYISGIRDLYVKYKITGADAALDALEQQLTAYNAWTEKVVMPHTRSDFKLPPELYAYQLKQMGIDISTERLMREAQLEFIKTQAEMQLIAPTVAKSLGMTSNDYRDVINMLKKEQLDKQSIVPQYHDVIGKIEAIIKRENIITLPQTAMIMRTASDAESAQIAAPHMQPPPLINNHGEVGEFVLSLGVPASTGTANTKFDDFTYKAAAWSLTAHEGRPGHELQFAGMVKGGVSLARSIFAFNSVNVEGWALYSEAEMLPYEPADAQLAALDARLLRAARAFLDPMLNLGLITPERAHEILVHDVCASEALAQEELDRYMFQSPGQATSYFYGYSRLMQLRAETQIAMGAAFNRKAFNDFIVSQGLLPPDEMSTAVKKEFVQANKSSTSKS
ncbi:DUF885 domain-containing protein [Glaciimonas soli]|uniref:DUF885 family protein n=1 Tax=Glaciimonas soli TaxID=2590999 RepID=A0A843YJ49_9BURK|nr:DUF885 domain-containing protein [Glaciimonas soli]MQQ99808.1 DUF885 family protein [Glaciimonas soli]